jgi:hypothetical protein
LRVRRNYPYQGRNDGLTLPLRRRFPPTSYVGVELEINQKHVRVGDRIPASLARAIVDALRETLDLSYGDGPNGRRPSHHAGITLPADVSRRAR